MHLNLEFVNIYFTYISFTKKFELPECSCNSLNLKLLNDFFSKFQNSSFKTQLWAISHRWQMIKNCLNQWKSFWCSHHLSYGLRDLIHSGKKFQSFNLFGSQVGFIACIALIIAISNMLIVGTITPIYSTAEFGENDSPTT